MEILQYSKIFMDDTSISAELEVPLGNLLPSAHHLGNQFQYDPRFLGNMMGNVANSVSQLGAAAAGIGTAITGAAAGAAAAVAAGALSAGKALGSELTSNPAALLPGKYGDWVRSGRYDYPVGGSDIDLYHNRLCFDEPCRYDPENSGDYGMEWLRRAVPLREYPYPPVFHRMHVEIEKPDREFSLIPYGEAVGATRSPGGG